MRARESVDLAERLRYDAMAAVGDVPPGCWDIDGRAPALREEQPTDAHTLSDRVRSRWNDDGARHARPRTCALLCMHWRWRGTWCVMADGIEGCQHRVHRPPQRRVEASPAPALPPALQAKIAPPPRNRGSSRRSTEGGGGGVVGYGPGAHTAPAPSMCETM
eukprot:COSAG01_NODE_19905_length_982_cov_30.893545_1_plen_162_part_00